MILILTERADIHADRVEARLRARGTPVARVDPADFPAENHLSLRWNHASRSMQLGGRDAVDLMAVDTVWWRRPGRPRPASSLADPYVRDGVAEECESFLSDVWESMPARWVPAPLPALRRGGLKARQLGLAAQIGLEIPPTLISNDPDEVVDFYNEHGGDVISKRAAVSRFSSSDSEYCRYTEAVSTRDMAAVSSVSYCPMIFQARIEKRFELRVTIVGTAVFAAEIHSQQSNHTRLDWRRYDHYETTYAPHELPVAVSDLCVTLVRSLGLCFAALDLIVTPDGRYVFLEINPNGQYLWIEHFTGIPLTDAMCELLEREVTS